MSLLSLSFASPWLLLVLAGAPLLYLLLRVTPPPPQRVAFPPLKLILDLKKPDATPARTPLWLLLLRMALAAAVVLAMAGPMLTPPGVAALKKGPLLLLVDDGWTAASDWTLRMDGAESRLQAAIRDGRAAAVLAFSEPPAEGLTAQDAAGALSRLRALKPKAFLPARAPALGAIAAFLKAHPAAEIVWVTDGLDDADGASFAARLAALAPEAEILRDPRGVRVIASADNGVATLEAHLLRSAAPSKTSLPSAGRVRALDAKGASLGDADFDFGNGLATKASFDLPVQLRNEIARLEILGAHSAGAVLLLDAGSRRRRVGLVAGEMGEQPLLSSLHYLRDALSPFADLREAKPGAADPIGQLLDEGVDVLILADVNAAAPAVRKRLDAFLASGGTLLRFAGPHLAAARGDDLFPTRLRRSGRTLGGAMSWERPKPLAPFDQSSPFFGLSPPHEVTVSRQVLAEPEEGLPAKTWARLADGTPLVTAERRGPGTLVLFHVTADPSWSNLPMSGLFVDMLKRIVDRAGYVARTSGPGAETQAFLAPLKILDGFGVAGAPPASVKPLPAKGVSIPSADHPAGLYGPAAAPRALNAFNRNMKLTPLDFSGLKLRLVDLSGPRPVDLRPPLLILAFVLALADALAMIWLGGRWRRQVGPAKAGPAIAGLALLLALAPPPAKAEVHSPRDIQAALTTSLAYVVTGDPRVDRISRQGLYSLSQTLAERTSFVPGQPQAIDPAHDELAFYPLLYWPVAPDRPQPTPEVARRIEAYMKQGGLVLFDTRDAGMQVPGGPPTPAHVWLQNFLKNIDLPPLEPAPANHVVYRTFYILDNFAGRTENGPTYIEALPPEREKENRPALASDGVSPIIVASNDLAAAWAGDPAGEGLYPLTPGGARQREMALRGGVNIVMYTLTGNYKADQVHVRELLERLSR
ncbi:DUF4159 domain-containing protein [Rhodoblastus acidophilus]|uniref:DUF4159 domain-containing protein n=1 Tax=Candidatus Rhodoblastus alkanivorans TaxID=2954117 RepID=A0ABS9Z5I6_9HYPH|nr:DUF4159 domain-containing protein [Candidatus Rhodoblastus alkanivorans]MCI4677633.1 DUF4159 domain-containing protein [Candidatus Rhodoblastus alkanivorans]MCI4682635.1 DUF4159 domain-containing protein [Candidatus Rhodoblastus alkanivorans]MDI4639941.1 DUF4159 domain-containing protein [Rhodoblastus acidophilus]